MPLQEEGVRTTTAGLVRTRGDGGRTPRRGASGETPAMGACPTPGRQHGASAARAPGSDPGRWATAQWGRQAEPSPAWPISSRLGDGRQSLLTARKGPGGDRGAQRVLRALTPAHRRPALGQVSTRQGQAKQEAQGLCSAAGPGPGALHPRARCAGQPAPQHASLADRRGSGGAPGDADRCLVTPRGLATRESEPILPLTLLWLPARGPQSAGWAVWRGARRKRGSL